MNDMAPENNPFLAPFTTHLGTPPYSKIKNEHYLPAIEAGIRECNDIIDSIVNSQELPTLDNTVVALERDGDILSRVCGVFFPLLSAMNDDEKMEISLKASALLSEHSTSVLLNERLWQRVKYVHDHTDADSLTPEDAMLLKNTYDMFMRSGATLEGEARDRYKAIRAELSELTTRFSQNIVKELPQYKVFLSASDLDGLPDSAVEAAALAASKEGREGEYLFTLDQPVYTSFMRYSTRDDLRKRLYLLYTRRNTAGEFSNLDILKRIAELRLQMANLLGRDCYADLSLENTMAANVDNVYKLLIRLAEAYREPMRKELSAIAEFASQTEGHEVEITPWNYSYYSNKLRQHQYGFDPEMLRPYFKLENVVNGVFGLATRLYGLSFRQSTQIERYHEDVVAYEVYDADSCLLGVLYADFFPRQGKQPGAWMTDVREQQHLPDGTDVRPIISIVMNFTKPTATKPSLLTADEVRTLLHEFGHALHGLLSRVNYKSLSGTNVYRDFVELPSQFNENFLSSKEFIDTFVSHYITGEPLPQNLMDGLIASMQFGAAYACMRQLYFGMLDMGWHTITGPQSDVESFEHEATSSVEIFKPIEHCMVSPQFGHIFSGGYAAGYYSYKWAEVLDADAFSVFEREGVFNKDTAMRFRREILEKGGTENPDLLYKRFRKGEPSIDALLKRDGII